MSPKNSATRRSFLKKGALLAVPLAAAAAPAAIAADDSLKSRLARLEDEAAIRNLHHSWLKQASTGTGTSSSVRSKGATDETVRNIAADHAAPADAIEIAPDRKTASGRFHCVVEVETSIAPDSTLAQMAHAQGSGFVRRTERRLLRVAYAKSAGAWSVASAEFASA